MCRSTWRLWLVQSLSAFRIVGALMFASVAFQNVPDALLVGFYGLAVASDIADGYFARRLNAQTYLGKVLDLVSDKSLTIVSLMYAAARGISLLPLALIATREIVMIGARLVTLDRTPLFPTNRLLGGSTAVVLWTNTLLLAIGGPEAVPRASIVYWICALVLNANLAWRIWSNAARIKAALGTEK